jgi:ribonuclease HI
LDGHKSLVQLERHNRVQLIGVTGQEGIVAHETADQLAKLGFECLLIGPEPASGISVGVTKKAVREWIHRDHKKHWESLTGLETGKGTHTRTLWQKNQGIVNINQLRWVTGLHTGRLFKIGLTGA